MTFGSTTYRQINGRGLAEAAVLIKREFMKQKEFRQVQLRQVLVYHQCHGLIQTIIFGCLVVLTTLAFFVCSRIVFILYLHQLILRI